MSSIIYTQSPRGAPTLLTSRFQRWRGSPTAREGREVGFEPSQRGILETAAFNALRARAVRYFRKPCICGTISAGSWRCKARAA
jgi:hypothetical protein